MCMASIGFHFKYTSHKYFVIFYGSGPAPDRIFHLGRFKILFVEVRKLRNVAERPTTGKNEPLQGAHFYKI